MTFFMQTRVTGTPNEILFAVCDLERMVTKLRRAVDLATMRGHVEGDIDWTLALDD